MKEERNDPIFIKGMLVFMLVIGLIGSVLNPFISIMFGSISATIGTSNAGENGENKSVVRMGFANLAILVLAGIIFFVLKNVLHLYGG